MNRMTHSIHICAILCLLLHEMCICARETTWYDGIDGVKVLSQDQQDAQQIVDEIAGTQLSDSTGQFNSNRYAVLLLPGNHTDLNINVGFYTSIIGVGPNPDDVRVSNVQSFDGTTGGATQNFWRSVEGVRVTNESSTWAVSQASPIRRSIFDGDLWLSEQGPPHWSSGGFLADTQVRGTLHLGTQQQWCFRNSNFDGAVNFDDEGWNYVFIGCSNAPVRGSASKPFQVSNIANTPRIAEKPYLVTLNNAWYVRVPNERSSDSPGVTRKYNDASSFYDLELTKDIFVARSDQHTGSAINTAVASGTWKGVLFTPGIYEMDEALRVELDDFVVLGIGFPTLISQRGQSCVSIGDGTTNVRVAGLILEAGTSNEVSNATEPLLKWGTQDFKSEHRRSTLVSGVLSDVFARVGSFKYAEPFKESCLVTRSDVMLEINADNVVIDSTWLWQADHDDCDSQSGGALSDQCRCDHGLVVNGNNVTVYGLQVEHMTQDLLQWHGDGGEVYMYQSELPYHDTAFGQNYHGYVVSSSTTHHLGIGIGVYIIGGGLEVESAILAPVSSNITNMLTLTIGGSPSQFHNIICDASGKLCSDGDGCNGIGCYLHNRSTAPPSPPPLPPGCFVGSDAFLPGVPGTPSPTPTESKGDCGRACASDDSLPCLYWKFGSNGNWCQLFASDGHTDPGWPIPGAKNQTDSIIFSGTTPGNGC